MVKIKEKQEADKLVGRCFLWSDIPFSIAKNNPFYQSMFDVVAIVGLRYKAPTYDELRGPILQNEKVNCTRRLEELKESWEVTRCTMMSDGWTDGRAGPFLISWLIVPGGQCLLNLLMHLHMLKMQHYYVSCWMGSFKR
jgi:hypothetical protein